MANYDELIKTYKKENIIEKIETIGKPGLVHYLPHRLEIKNERETTEARILYDVSSKMGNNPSLNDFLHSGTCLLPLIFDILFRFRIVDMVLVADIKRVFLNIEIDDCYRDFLRFLWVENIYQEKWLYIDF